MGFPQIFSGFAEGSASVRSYAGDERTRLKIRGLVAWGFDSPGGHYLVRMNSSRSVLMVSASVVGIPWGKPL